MTKGPVGMSCRSMNCLAKTLLPSISAAAFWGPKTKRPRAASSSARPSESGSSGPTTVRSIRLSTAKSASSWISSGEIGTPVASGAVPGLPGAQ